MHTVQACWLRHSLAAHVSRATLQLRVTPQKKCWWLPLPPIHLLMRLKTAWLMSLGDQELRYHCCLSSVLLPCLLTEPLCLEGLYLNDPFNLGYISSTHSQAHMDFMGQDMPYWRTLFWGGLFPGQHVAIMPVGVYKHSLM